MSRTFKDRPYRVRMLDRRNEKFATRTTMHCGRGHANGECDEHLNSPEHRSSLTRGGRTSKFFYVSCSPELDVWSFGDYRRKPYRRAWFGVDRTRQRMIAGKLVRAANGGNIEDAEDIIDNRNPVSGSDCYNGGYRD